VPADPEGRFSGRRSGLVARLPEALAWAIVTPLAVCAGARVGQLDEASFLLLLAAGLTPWLCPPALVALAIGLRQGRPLLAVVAAATTGVLLATAVAGFGVPVRPPAGTVAAVRLFTANIHHMNPGVGRIAEEVAAAAPDLLALQEVDPDGAARLARSGVLDRFPYSVTETRSGASGIALWSRFPLVDVQVQDVHGRPFIGATAILGTSRLRLCTVHMVAPLGGDRARWQAQLRHLGEEIHGERGALVVAGDFNATRHHPSFRRLLSDGMADAHEERGRGWAATWPRNRWPLPPLMRLDHVLVSPGVGVRSIREGLGQGSDHRPIIADLVLLP
jgi:endonuclease/exonuclease/phosphatase family metal-dependent hydrolase